LTAERGTTVPAQMPVAQFPRLKPPKPALQRPDVHLGQHALDAQVAERTAPTLGTGIVPLKALANAQESGIVVELWLLHYLWNYVCLANPLCY